ncbi:UNVERIFIED_CONTAM: hypothetical protein FKN15_068237 [Acipenser sinensis]
MYLGQTRVNPSPSDPPQDAEDSQDRDPASPANAPELEITTPFHQGFISPAQAKQTTTSQPSQRQPQRGRYTPERQ